jgi:hypothetical protein
VETCCKGSVPGWNQSRNRTRNQPGNLDLLLTLEEEEGLLVGELGWRMVTEESLMGEDLLVKKRRVTGRESMTIE